MKRREVEGTSKSKKSNSGKANKTKEIEERQVAIKTVEKKYIAKVAGKILAARNNSSPAHGSLIVLRQCESFRKYSARIKDTIYQIVYNMLMEASSTGSSYSFTRRTAGNALDESEKVFMKDVDVDYISRQAILQAFKEQVVNEEEEKSSQG